MSREKEIFGIDLFCGVGGLSRGLAASGITVVAGVDVDPRCRFPFEKNIQAKFFESDIRELKGEKLRKLFPSQAISLLAGCAPCQPFSKLRKGHNTSKEIEWSLLDEFGRLVREIRPDLVTMENVVGLKTKSVFDRFLRTLADLEYEIDWRSVSCAKLGIPQTRRRLVLIASRIGAIAVPQGELEPAQFKTVRQTVGGLPPLSAGNRDAADRLHAARALSEINLKRIRASRPGGTWKDWPEELLAKCHRKASGKSFRSVYARMSWDAPAPTITTEFHNFGTGRFGHPAQHRAISLREAAMLQTFPQDYEFLSPSEEVEFQPLGRLIGNAVPPKLGYHIGRAMLSAIGS
jgi:DNA (cytosine-5)-methyltransferase 1